MSVLLSVVPVLPTTGRSMLARLPVPPSTTPRRMSVTVSAMAGLSTGVPTGFVLSVSTDPSGWVTLSTGVTFGFTPWLAIVAYADAMSRGETLHWPRVMRGDTH